MVSPSPLPPPVYRVIYCVPSCQGSDHFETSSNNNSEEEEEEEEEDEQSVAAICRAGFC